MERHCEHNLLRNIEQLLAEDYIIPLYQRNYNWGVIEIRQFMQDIYGCFANGQNKNYYIGSLVVFKRNKEDEGFEVIDGQQRLTTIHLMARLLLKDCAGLKHLHYDSRPEVKTFFERLTCEKENIYKHDEDEEVSNLVNFFAAIHSILHEKLESEISSTITIAGLKQQGKLEEFASYFFKKVMLVRVEMPPDTDVASYFEIMNNRGRQLQEHEILKALLMSKIENSKDRLVFGNVWEACSQMDRPIHKFFNADQRRLLFGENYNNIRPQKIHELEYAKDKVASYSLLDILDTKASRGSISAQREVEEEIDEAIEYTSIIDFTNFLIHVLRLIYEDADIPLSSDRLLDIYQSIPINTLQQVSSMGLIKKILFYRVVFDRFTVKSELGSENTDQHENDNNAQSLISPKARWMLLKPVMYMKNASYKGRKYPSLNFNNTFDDKGYQGRVIKLLSMLQVTYRQRKNKNYLQFILGLFNPDQPDTIDIKGDDFIRKVEDFVLGQFDKLELASHLESTANKATDLEMYAEGTNTPHFVFNLIDYLLWIGKVWKKRDYAINEEFDFTYRNSIEHHYPRALETHLETEIIGNKSIVLNSLGNLFLVGKSANSKLNDREPIGKAADPRFNLNLLTPKRKLMYNITNAKKKWNEEEIVAHYKCIITVLKERKDILAF